MIIIIFLIMYFNTKNVNEPIEAWQGLILLITSFADAIIGYIILVG